MSDKHVSVVLFVVFVFFSLILFAYIGYVERGFVQDGIFFFDQFLESEKYKVITNNTMRMRYFSCMILQLPMAIVKFGFNIKTTEILSRIFSFSLVFLPFLTIFWNLILSKRTKRYDIFVCSVALYVFGILPFFYYSIVELFISISLYLVLLHYLISKIEYKIYDYIPIALLCIFLFSSHEFIGFFGFVLFFFSIFCFKNKKLTLTTRISKLITGICGLLSGALFWFYYFTPNGPDIQADGGLGDFTQNINSIPMIFTNPHGIYSDIFILTILFFIFFLFYKKKINTNFVISLSFLYICLVFLGIDKFSEDKSLYLKEFANISILCRFTGALIFCLIILYLVFVNFIKKDYKIIKNIQTKIKNIFILVLITGLSISFFQFFFTKAYKNEVSEIIKFINKNPYTLINLCNYKNSDEIYMTFAPEMFSLLSIYLFNNDEKMNKLVLTTDYKYISKIHCYLQSKNKIITYPFDSYGFYFSLTEEKSDIDLEALEKYFRKNKIYCKE